VAIKRRRKEKGRRESRTISLRHTPPSDLSRKGKGRGKERGPGCTGKRERKGGEEREKHQMSFPSPLKGRERGEGSLRYDYVGSGKRGEGEKRRVTLDLVLWPSS